MAHFLKKPLKMIKYVLLLLPIFFYSQTKKILFIDDVDKNPIVGLQIFSQNGNFLGNSDSNGEFNFDLNIFLNDGIIKINGYNSNYYLSDYEINIVPNLIHLKKIVAIELETVTIEKKVSKKYFPLYGYFRSWQLVNNKLVKYGDGLIQYQMPYADVTNEYNTGIINRFIAYRTFKTDSIKHKSRIISFGGNNGYLDVFITKNDLLKRNKNLKTLKTTKKSMDQIIENNKLLGFVIYDELNNPKEINVSESFEGNEAIKIMFWKISGKYSTIEKWFGEGKYRHPTYLFSSNKSMVKTKVEGKFNSVETITEIFINDLEFDDQTSKKTKRMLDRERSFYEKNYWDEQLSIHPLPSEIKTQLTNVNENKNNY